MIPFKPTVEPNLPGGFLTEHPVQIIQGGQSARVPLIVGITKEDGALRAAGKTFFFFEKKLEKTGLLSSAVLNRADLLSDLNRHFERLMPLSLMYDKTARDVRNVTAQLRKFYFGNEEVTWLKRQRLVNVSGGAIVVT